MTTESRDIVLVVDDSPDSLGMINTALDDAGYTVLVALNGLQALAIVEKIQPTIILLDAMMPVMDGFECCPRLRAMMPLTPIIFMTGLADTEHVVQAFEVGGSDYITKPIKPQELLARIKVHCQQVRHIADARDALDLARQYVFAVDNKGLLLWTTPDTEHLLRENHCLSHDFTARLEPWLLTATQDQDLHCSVNGISLTIRYFKAISDNEHLLRFVQQDVVFSASELERSLPLTPRESEVLLWVAHGKSNKEIGEILVMSPRTVNKHLEQIYPKIQADNRTAATSIAIKTLLGYSF